MVTINSAPTAPHSNNGEPPIPAILRLKSTYDDFRALIDATLPFVIDGGDGASLANRSTTAASASDSATKPISGTEVTEAKKSANPGIIKEISDLITVGSSFAQDHGGKLYLYMNGAFAPKADRFIRREVKRLCHALEADKHWNSRLASEVCEYIRVDAPELWEQPPLNVVNVKNGLLDLTTAELRPHSSDHLSSIQLPVTFDPAAACPAIEEFIQQIFPSDALLLAFEIPAWLMVPDLSIQKAILLAGEGANGKSRYLTAVQAFIGKHNTTGVSLHKLESDRFSVARLIGKLANICPDLPTEHLASTSIFKALVGGDPVMAEYKFRDSFEIRPFARLLFSANHLPHSNDGSHGFFRRWEVVPFNRTFEQTEQIDQVTLDARLSAPSEMSGLLNKAIEARRGLVSRKGFTQADSLTMAAEEFRATTDPMAVWFDQNTIEGSEKFVAKGALYAAYNNSMRHSGRAHVTSNAFGRAVKRLRSSVTEAQRSVSGKTVWCHIGLGLLDSRH